MQRSAKIAVAIPALNEEESIGEVVRQVLRGGLVEHVIVADGGSNDSTADVAREAGADVLAVGRGYGRACLAAAEAAHSADIIVFMDGDGADDPAYIAALIGPIEAGTHDFVIGSRVRGEREPGSMATHQIAAGLAAGLAIRVVCGVRYTDMCAFRAIRREMLLSLNMREMTYGWNIEMQMRAARTGLRVLEIPVSCRRRLGGQSKVAGEVSAAPCALARKSLPRFFGQPCHATTR